MSRRGSDAAGVVAVVMLGAILLAVPAAALGSPGGGSPGAAFPAAEAELSGSSVASPVPPATSPTGPAARTASVVDPGIPASANGSIDFWTEQAPDPDNTVTRVRVYPNGTARWTVDVRIRLSNETDVEEFRAFQDEVGSGDGEYLDPFEERMTRVVEGADGATDREMDAAGFAIETRIQEVPRRWGIVTYEFTWKSFARTEGDRLVVGDVFRGGLFLAEGDVMEFRPPDGYQVASVSPDPDDRGEDVAWSGRRDFADHRPRATFEPAPAPTPTPTPGGGGDPGSGTPDDSGDDARDGADGTPGSGDDPDPATPTDTPDEGDSGGILVAIGGILAVVLLAGVYLVRSDGHAPFASDGVDETGGDDGDGERTILTDEDRVIDLLESEGGQIKQSEVADRLEWSSSKTSRTLSDMADEGGIEKIRIGRENVIRIPEEEDEEEDAAEPREW